MSTPFHRFCLPSVGHTDGQRPDAATILRRWDLQANLLLSCGYTLQAERLAFLAAERRAATTEKLS